MSAIRSHSARRSQQQVHTTELHPTTAQARPWLALVASTAGGVMVGLDGTATTIAAPYIARSVHATLPELELIANAYLVVLALGLLPAGRIADRFGRRATFITGVLAFGISSIAIALSGSVAALASFRAVQGFAGALLQPAALALLRTSFAPERRSLAIGIWSGMNALAIGVGPVIAGLLVQSFGWPTVFAVNLPIGIAAALGARLSVAESRAPGARVLSTLRVLLKQRTIAVAGFVIAASSFGIFGLLFMLTLYLQNVRAFSPVSAGLWLLAPTAVVVVSAPAGGVLGDRFGPRWPMATGLLLACAGIYGVGLVGVAAGYWQVVLPALAVGLGTGLCVVPATNALLTTAGERFTGMASAIQQAASQFGGLLGIAVLGTMLSRYVAGTLPDGAAGADEVAQGRAPVGLPAGFAHATFTSGMGLALCVAAGVTGACAIGAAIFARR